MSTAAAACDGAGDDELLRRVAEERDREAFEALFSRHQNRAYALALNVSGSPQLAEEAVQEAMLGIWRSARSYRPGGNARAWICRIVARKACVCARHHRNQGPNMDAAIESNAAHAGTAADEMLAQDELHRALRAEVGRLPERSRVIVGLYFLAGLSQDEIGRELNMPQRTVSLRLEQALAYLRRSLAQAGFASAAAIVQGPALTVLLERAYPAPPDLGARIFATVQGAGLAARSTARSAAVASRAPVLGWAVALGVAALALAAAVWFGTTSPAAPAAPALPAAAEAPRAVAAAEPADEAPALPALYRRVWTFEAGAPKDLAVRHGRWTWAQAADGHPAAMVADTTLSCFIELPREVFARGRVPVELLLYAQPSDARSLSGTCLATWAGAGGGLPSLASLIRWNAPFTAHSVHRVCFLGRSVVLFRDGEPKCVFEYEDVSEADRICIVVRNWRIDRIELRELPDEEAAALRDDPALKFETFPGKPGRMEGFSFPGSARRDNGFWPEAKAAAKTEAAR